MGVWGVGGEPGGGPASRGGSRRGTRAPAYLLLRFRVRVDDVKDGTLGHVVEEAVGSEHDDVSGRSRQRAPPEGSSRVVHRAVAPLGLAEAERRRRLSQSGQVERLDDALGDGLDRSGLRQVQHAVALRQGLS